MGQSPKTKKQKTHVLCQKHSRTWNALSVTSHGPKRKDRLALPAERAGKRGPRSGRDPRAEPSKQKAQTSLLAI